MTGEQEGKKSRHRHPRKALIEDETVVQHNHSERPQDGQFAGW